MLQGLLLRLTLNLWVGEVFNLRWEHVNFTDGTITVVDSKNAMNRVVYMPEQVKDMLVKHQAETKGQPGRLVFPKAGTRNTPHHQISPGFRMILRDTKLNEGITDPRDCGIPLPRGLCRRVCLSTRYSVS